MPYNNPFIRLSDTELQRVNSDQASKVAYVDALTYFHDGLCQYLYHPVNPVYPHIGSIDTDNELFDCMKKVGSIQTAAAHIEDNTATMRDLQRELNENPSATHLTILVDNYIKAVIDEFIRLKVN